MRAGEWQPIISSEPPSLTGAPIAQLREIESFAKSELDRKLVNMARAFRIAGTTFVLPPGIPKVSARVSRL